MLEKDNRSFASHVKGLFNPAQLSALRDHYQQIESSQQPESVSERERLALLRGESTDKLRMLTAWYTIWQDEALAGKFAPYTYVTYPVQVRHVQALNHHVPWHQDIAYMRLLGNRAPKQVITCFVPLEPEPSKCTTIQFAQSEDAAPQTEYSHVLLDGFGAGIVNDNFEKKFHFELSLGDALVFGDHALHRTYLPSGCVVKRRSLEFRLVMPEHVVIGRDYYDINKKCFVAINEIGEVQISTVS